MRSSFLSRFTVLARVAIAAGAAVTFATPAAAQFGGLRNKIKKETSTDANAAAPAQGGTVVLTTEVVNQLLTGLKAGQAERALAEKEDTPYGRYQRAEVAYREAKPKCEAAQASWPQRAAGNQKLVDKYSALTEKMVAAMEKQDQRTAAIYQDSAMAMMDPSCVVKEPKQPDDYYEAVRAVDARAEKAEVKASDLAPGELAQVKERAIAILQGSTPPGDASASEKSAVSARSAELKTALGILEPVAEAPKPEPKPAAVATPAPATPQTTPGGSDMASCMTKNMQTHQAEIEALGKRAEAAQKAGDQARLMALADTLQRIQMAGCGGR
jgi:hypothetical protein